MDSVTVRGVLGGTLRDLRAIWPRLLVAILPVAVLASLPSLAFLLRTGVTMEEAMLGFGSAERLGLWTLATLAAGVVSGLGLALGVVMGDAHQRGEAIGAGEAWRRLGRRAWNLLLTDLLVAGLLLLAVVLGTLATLGFLPMVGLLLAFLLMCVLWLAPAASVLERNRPYDNLRRSHRLLSDHGAASATLLMLHQAAFGLPALLLLLLLTPSLLPPLMPPLMVEEGTARFALWALSALLALVQTAVAGVATARTYHATVRAEEEAAPAPEPAPAAS